MLLYWCRVANSFCRLRTFLYMISSVQILSHGQISDTEFSLFQENFAEGIKITFGSVPCGSLQCKARSWHVARRRFIFDEKYGPIYCIINQPFERCWQLI